MSYTFSDCETVRRRLPERRELTGEASHGMEEHLSSCAACAAEAARYEALQDTLDRAASLELSPWFREKLHRDIMAAVDDLAPLDSAKATPEPERFAAASVLRPTFLALRVAAIFAIFSLAILFFLWNPITLNKHAPEAVPLPQQAAVLPTEGVPHKAGMENAEPPVGRALAPRKVSGEEKMAALSEGEAALAEKVGVTVRFESDATVLEWAGPREALYRVTRSFGPDFETASHLEFIEVEGLRYRDLDARPGTRFYRVEKIG